MPEITGVVAAKSGYGIKLDRNEDWWNWSKVEYRGQPFDTTVQKGDTVRVVYNQQEKQDPDTGEPITKTFISVIDRVVTSRDVTPPDPDDWPEDEAEAPQTPPAAREWGVGGKDLLMAKENAIKVAGEIYAACIVAGIYKTLPTPDTITAYAEAIEATLD